MKAVRPGKSRLFPMVLSALVSGAGQLVQGRWVAGIFFMVVSFSALGWLLHTVFGVLKAYYRLVADPMNSPSEVPGLAELIIPFFIWLAIYVAGIIDTAMANYRQQVKASRSHKG
jgi:hypothetical protein